MAGQCKFEFIKLAQLDACRRTARELGYVAIGHVEKGIKLYNPNNSRYATITQYDGHPDLIGAWILTEYNYEPSSDEPIGIRPDHFGTLRTFEVWRPEHEQ